MEQNKKVAVNENSEADANIDIVAILFKYLRHWKLISVIVLASLLLGIVYIIVTSKQYQSSTSILLNEDSSKQGGASIDLQILGLSNNKSNVDNEIELLSSPDLMLKVVDSLNLNYTYTITKRFRETDIYTTTPYFVKLEDDKILNEYYIEFTIEKKGDSYRIEGFYKDIEKNTFEFEEEIPFLPMKIDILGTKLLINVDKEKEKILEEVTSKVKVKINNPIQVADLYSKAVQVNTASKYSTVLSLTVKTANKKKGEDILSRLVKEYNAENVIDKNQTSENTVNFINERLKSITTELEAVERGVEEFKQQQGITNLSGEAKLYVEQSAVATDKLSEIQTQLSIINYVEEFITDPQNKYKAIPNLGLTDAGLSASIREYNAQIIDFDGVLRSTSDDSPSRQRMDKALLIYRENIISLVKIVKQSVVIAKQDAEKQLAANSGKIKALPTQERELLDIMRQRQIKEGLYLFLLQKREESSISLASTSDKAKTIIKPRSENVPVSPQNRIVLFGSFITGLIASIVIIYLKQLFRNKIQSREELEELTKVPVIGQIIRSDEPQPIVVHKSSDTPIAELFRYVRNNIEFVLENGSKKVILITSTESGEGKTFISANLACSFGLNEKKVLLVGMDIRNPQLSTVLNFPRSKGFADYLSKGIDDWHNLVKKPVSSIPNLDVLEGGTVPPNPNELLKSKRVEEFFNQAREEYDLIIVDAAPLGIISDTFLLSKYSDFSLYIVRENVTHKTALNFVNTVYEEGRFQNLYILLNDSVSTSKDYKYGYNKAYGYGKK